MHLLAAAFLSVILTGIALIAPGAHLYELANKIGLPQDEYYVVQGIYRGWWMVGLALPLAFAANLWLAIASRRDRLVCVLAAAAAALIAVNLAIFAAWTNPANVATSNWTLRPPDWEALRVRWEYSHAVNAGVILLALCLATGAALTAAARLGRR